MNESEGAAPVHPIPPGPWVETLQIVLRRGLDLRERGDLDGAKECFERCRDLSHSVVHRPLEGCAHACLGTISMTQGDTEGAAHHYRTALEIRTELHDLLGQARSLNDLALCDLRNGQADSALSRLRESLSRSAGEPPGQTRAQTLEHLGRVHRDRGDFKEALRFLKDALEVRRELQDEPGIAADLNSIGMVYHLMARPEEAFDHLRRAYELRRSFSDRRAIAVTANNLALVHYGQGHLEEAEALLGEALAAFQAVGDRAGVAHGHSNLGLVFADQGRMDQARRHHQESLRIREELGDIPGRANSLNNLSHLAMERGRPLEALRFAERSLELRRGSGLSGAIAKPLYNKGRALLDLGELDQASEMAREVIQIARDNGSAESEMEGHLLFAEILLGTDRVEEAASAADAAVPLAEKTKDPRLIASAYRTKAMTCTRRGSPDDARDLLARAERCLRGRSPSGEMARIHREQGCLAAAAGASQSAVERLQKAAEEFAAIGNSADQARTLAHLARAAYPQSAGQAMRSWDEARTLARAADGRDRPVDLGPPPGTAAPRTEGARSPFLLIHDLLETLSRSDSPPQLGGWLARVRLALGVRTIGLVCGPTDDREGDATPTPLADGRILWTPPGQDAGEEIPLLLEPPGASKTAAGIGTAGSRIVEAIPGTDGSCCIAATGASISDDAKNLLSLLAFVLGERRIAGIGPVGQTQRTSRTDIWEGLVGSSSPMKAIYGSIARVARSDVSVLILGESGTGKELVARAVHARSTRSSGPFVPINCPSIPRELIEAELFGHEKGAYTGATTARPGKVELADGGTLFLDEIGDMDLPTQSKLLRFLQEREFQRVGGRQTLRVDVRVLAATSRDLNQAMEGGTFRTDLYYRLNVVPITLPPLRDRPEDIPDLIRHFLAEIGEATGRTLSITPRAMEFLQGHSWPGNIRELRNTVARMAAMTEADTLDTTHIPPSIHRRGPTSKEREGRSAGDAADLTGPLRPGETLQDRLVEVEAHLLRRALETEGWNQSAAARRLGTTETMIRNRIRKFSIKRPESPLRPGTGGTE